MTFSKIDNLSWDVTKVPVTYEFGGVTHTHGDRFVVVRNDTGAALGVVGEGYEPVQNSSLLGQVTPLESEGVLTRVNTGVLSGGRKVFVQSKLAEEFEVAGETTRAMVTLLNGHDGKVSTKIGLTAVRVICGNTFAMASTDLSVVIRHIRGANERVITNDFVRNFTNEQMGIYAHNMERLKSTSCSIGTFESIMTQVFKKENASQVREMDTLKDLFRNGAGNNGRTLADAFNAVTDWSSHQSAKSADRIYVSSNFGRGAALSSRAWDLTLAAV